MSNNVHEPWPEVNPDEHEPCTTGQTVARTILDMTPEEIQRLSGMRIRQLREAKGLSLSELAARTGNKLAKSRISNYEQAIRMPGPWEAAVLARALDTSAAYLLCLEEGQPTMSQDEIALIFNLRALPLDLRRNFAGRIAGMAAGYAHALPDEQMAQRLHQGTPPGQGAADAVTDGGDRVAVAADQLLERLVKQYGAADIARAISDLASATEQQKRPRKTTKRRTKTAK